MAKLDDRIERRIEQISDAISDYQLDRRELNALCTELGMSKENADELYAVAAHIHQFESVEKKFVKTVAQRTSAIKKIEKAAANLVLKMGLLSTDNLWAISKFMPPSELAFHSRLVIERGSVVAHISKEEPGIHPGYGAGGRAGHVLRECESLAIAAHKMQIVLTPKNGGGPRNLSGQYASFIDGLARFHTPPSVKIGRGGDFERLCDVVFSTAKVPAKSEGALRNYLKQKKAGFDWDAQPF